MREQNRRITELVKRERNRLLNFIKRRVPSLGDAEDILQDVFYEVSLAYQLPEPIEQMSAWMYRVALNRITDLFRKQKMLLIQDLEPTMNEEKIQDIYLTTGNQPDLAYAQKQLQERLALALHHLPQPQREVFIANELEGKKFNLLASETGESVNTLISRKRYAVLALQAELRSMYENLLF